MRRILAVAAVLIGSLGYVAHAGPGGGPGPVTFDSSTFTGGYSLIGTVGGVYNDSLSPVLSSVTAGGRMTAYRALHVNLRDTSGNAVGTSGNPLYTNTSVTIASATLTISSVTVTNSSFSVTGSTVYLGGIPAISGTVGVSNTFFNVSFTSGSVYGSTVTVSNTGFNINNSPTVLILSTPSVTVFGALPTGTNNVGTVTGSTVSILGTVPVSGVSGTTVTVTNPSFAVTGLVNVNGSTIAISNSGFNINNNPGVTLLNVATTTVSGLVSVNGSSVGVTGTVTALITSTPSVNVVNIQTTTVSGLVNVNGSTVGVVGAVNATLVGTSSVAVIGTPNVNIANTPSVNIANSPTVAITGISSVTIPGAVNVNGSTVGVVGTLTTIFPSSVQVISINIATVTISNTPSVNAIQSGTFTAVAQALNSGGVATSVGYSGGSTQLPVALTNNGVQIASITALAGGTGLDVNVIGGGGTGGTASNFAAGFPAVGTAIGLVSPTGQMQGARVDASSNIYVNVAVGTVAVSNAGFAITNTPAVTATLLNGTASIGRVALSAPNTTLFSSATFNFSSSGNTTVVASSGSLQVRLFQLILMTSAATNVTIQDGATPNGNQLGPFPMLANGAIVLDLNSEPWLTTVTGGSLIINQSGTAAITGKVWNTQQ